MVGEGAQPRLDLTFDVVISCLAEQEVVRDMVECLYYVGIILLLPAPSPRGLCDVSSLGKYIPTANPY